MDSTTLDSLRTDAQTAGNDASKVAQDVPGLLAGLKTNLTSVFTKDNPMFASRENALQTFLNAPSQTRANLLPDNQPIVAGSHLNFSPTQQDATVTAARNAALVPLAGLNSSIVGQYGNVNDMLGAAGNIFSSQAQAAKDKAANALNLYQTAIGEYNALHSSSNNSGIGDLSTILAAILGKDNQPATTPTGAGSDWEVVPPTAPAPFTGSKPLSQLLGGGSTTLPTGLSIPNVGPSFGSNPTSGYNFSNIPLNLGTGSSNGLSLAGGGSSALNNSGLHFQL